MRPDPSPAAALGVVAIDLERFAKAVAELVVSSLEREATSPWMDLATAATHLACSPERLRKQVQSQTIPFHQDRRGGRVFFHRDELDQWLLSQ